MIETYQIVLVGARMYFVNKSYCTRMKNRFQLQHGSNIIKAYFNSNYGTAWVDDIKNPAAYQIIIGDYCFFYGDATSIGAIELVMNIPNDYSSSVLIVITENKEWDKLIMKIYGNQVSVASRFSTCFSMKNVKLDLLEKYVETLPAQYKLQRIDRDIYNQTKEEKWCSDMCALFESPDDFLERGIGYAILLNDKLVSGASSYLAYKGNIEIEVQTKRQYRLQGLARVCSAKLVMTCIKNSIYPNWDAANVESLHISKQLGYYLKSKYDVLIISMK